ncbi:MAG: acetyl-CoA carboxylase biotin carboxylase subunit [Clostridia bacterium]|nr:acetyl-CoA carboxylase biotin carboxylase subunit [Clostridia bacterium]
MFDKILVANRGEIAVTVIRAARDMGIRTVAVCSEADREALHAQMADECVCIGPASSRDSYLNMQAVLTAASVTGAQAIHPGYGFLSENASFARLCRKCGITFISPPDTAMERMGDKASARRTAEEAGVPVVPGSAGVVATLADAQREAERIGYPVMVKASAGGGGRGMRIAEDASTLPAAFQTARAEALAGFGDDRVYLERYLRDPHHIEIQLMADQYGNVVHYGERECSIQRRNQKLVEEAASPYAGRELAGRMGEAAVRLAKTVGYVGAGTVEFLVDGLGEFYFMEMNTRIQVEHPVTEAVTRSNLVREQILVASGAELSVRQQDIRFDGHAIECRILAESPEDGFRPHPGTITALHIPGGAGVRVDSAMYHGYTIPPHYDSMIAKVIVHAPDRPQAIQRMRRTLTEFLVEGIRTNIDYQLAILRNPDFVAGNYNIGFVARHGATLLAQA